MGAYAKSRRSTGVIGRDGSFREARAACSTAATLDRELRMSPSSIVAAITSHSFTGRAPTRRTRYVDRRFAEQLKRRWARGDRPVTYTGTVGHTQQRGSRGAEDTRPGSPGRSISINGPRAAARDQECDKGLPHTHDNSAAGPASACHGIGAEACASQSGRLLPAQRGAAGADAPRYSPSDRGRCVPPRRRPSPDPEQHAPDRPTLRVRAFLLATRHPVVQARTLRRSPSPDVQPSARTSLNPLRDALHCS